jgi:competence protein ComEA
MQITRQQLLMLCGFVLVLGVVGFTVSWLNQPTAIAEILEPSEASVEVTAELLVIDVQGKIRNPGVYELPLGARVVDAINAAGGLLGKSQAGINQARFLEDGEQLVVGETKSSTVSDGKINLNSAPAIELEALPGVGPVLAQRIVQDRELNGLFKSVADLDRVSGVGPHIMQSVSELVTAQ